MSEITINQTNTEENTVEFHCPNCGVISRDDVIFLCNTCKQDEVVFKEGMYMCPACLAKGENFQCMLCDSKQVTMKHKKHHS